MSAITLVLAPTPTSQERDATTALARCYRASGHHVTILDGSLLGSALRLLVLLSTSSGQGSDVCDFHGARAGALSWITRVLKPGTLTVCTLHEREEFGRDQNFWGRMHVRLGTWIAMRCAQEIIATQKLLQVILFHQYRRLPTYIPQGVSLPQRKSERGSSLRGLRRGTYLVVVTEQRPKDLERLRREALSAGLPGRLVSLVLAPTPGVSPHRLVVPWNTPERDALLRHARAIIVPRSLRYPGWLRQIALAGRPLLVVETPEHRDALHTRAEFLPNISRENLREGLRRLARERVRCERRAVRAARTIAHLYAWEEIAKEFLRVYRKPDLEPVLVDSLSPRVSTS